ncbi:MAG TPA: redoxin domain-containing protein [Chloroflexi bacterium]|nr:redoxin domain-containing protein [Chloroflexota bacterium]
MELQRNYSRFKEVGAEIIALAVANISSVDKVRNAVGATYPMLADSQHRVAEAYGVYDLLGDKLAAPSVFVIDSDGRIVWQYIGHNSTDRPKVAQILEQIP